MSIGNPKVWFVTGAGSGIGAAVARAAINAGDRVVASGRNVEKLRSALADVAGDDLLLQRLDVTDVAEAQTAVDAAVARFGRIDVLVNNAGYSLLGNFEEMTLDQMERQFAPNFWGVVYVMRAVLPVMRRQHAGHIVNISSVAGVVSRVRLCRIWCNQICGGRVVSLRRARSRTVRYQVYVGRAGLLPHRFA